MSDYLDLIHKRRSVYALNDKTQIDQKQIMNVIERCVYEAPSAMNAQTPRLVVLFGESYQKFWRLVLNKLRAVVPADKFAQTEEKINSFTLGLGTILFYEDDVPTRELENKLPAYKDLFPHWAVHNNAILQYMIWLALEDLGLGANIQHYNPLIDDDTAHAFNIPKNWRLIAQMNFGAIDKPAGPKTHLPLKERIMVFK